MSSDAVLEFTASANVGGAGKRKAVAYIPNDYSSRCPFDSGLEVLAQGNMVVEKLQEEIALFLLVSDYMASDFCFGQSIQDKDI